jgi:hypothetical protein
MKCFCIKLSFAILLTLLLSGCGGEVPNPYGAMDVGGYDLYFYIETEEGVNMLDSTKKETFLKDLTFTYKGEDYPIVSSNEAGTRTLVPYFYGARLARSYEYKDEQLVLYDDWYAMFGGFDSTVDVDNQEIILSLGDNQKCTISFSNEFNWEVLPHRNRYFYLNGNILTDKSGSTGHIHFIYTSDGELEYVPVEDE